MYRFMRICVVLISFSAVCFTLSAGRADQRPVPSDVRDQVATEFAEKWVVSGGSTTFNFDPHVLAKFGLYVQGHDHGSAHRHDDADSVTLSIDSASHLTFSVVDGSLKRIDRGGIIHSGVLPLGLDGSEFNLDALMLAPADNEPLTTVWSLDPAHNGVSGGLVMEGAKVGFDATTRSLIIHSPALRLSRELAEFMGDAGLADVTIGSVTVHALAEWVGGAEPEGDDLSPGDEPLPLGGTIGPDMTFCQLFGLGQFGRSGDIVGLSEGTTSWNIGDEDLIWLNIPDEEHPFIVMNLYRLMNDRIEQIGQSHIKHGFFALGNHQCGGPPCSYEPGHGTGNWLGTGCTDTYGPGLNASQGGLGPRYEVNPWTGAWFYPGSHMQGGHGHDGEIDHRLQVHDSDLNAPENPGATYYAEGYYVMLDDVEAMNNASWKPVTPSGSPGGNWFFSMTSSGTLPEEGFAIDAWAGAQQTILAQEVPVTEFVSPDGRCKLAAKATDLGGGQWHYDYALLNIDMDRQVGSFRIPISPDSAISNIGFHAVEHHGEAVNTADADAVAIDNMPWKVTVFEDSIVWSTETNPLRWGTMYNFRFDVDAAPVSTAVTLDMFRPGTPGTVSGTTIGPDVDKGDFEVVQPDTLTIVRGIWTDGELEDLYFSDDSYVVVQPAALVPAPGPPVQVEVMGISPIDNPSELRFRYEGHVTVSPVEQQILLFNYETQEYDVVDVHEAATSDEQVEIVITDNPQRYIEAGTGQVTALMTFIALTFEEYLFAVVSFDRTVWLISP